MDDRSENGGEIGIKRVENFGEKVLTFVELVSVVDAHGLINYK